MTGTLTIADIVREAALSGDTSPDALKVLTDALNADTEAARQSAHAAHIEERDHKMRKSATRAKVRARAEIPQIVKDAVNDKFGSKFARMKALDDELTPIMETFGFHVDFRPGLHPWDDHHMHVVGTLHHKSGHRETFEDRRIPIADIFGREGIEEIHRWGATLTYAQRYMLGMIWGIAIVEDSDGNEDPFTVSTPGRVDPLRGEKAKALHKSIRDRAQALVHDLPKLEAFVSDPDTETMICDLPLTYREVIRRELADLVVEAAQAEITIPLIEATPESEAA